MDVVDLAKEAMEAAGVMPQVAPIRGGTDGAQLLFRGMPCRSVQAAPISTGAMNICLSRPWSKPAKRSSKSPNGQPNIRRGRPKGRPA